MRSRILWENIELWPYEETDVSGPAGTVLAEYIVHAYIENDLRKKLVKIAREEKSIVPACHVLHEALGKNLPLQDCLTWVKLLMTLVKDKPAAGGDDTSATDSLPPLLMVGKYWVRPEDIKDKTGWKIQGRKRNTIFKSKVVEPEREMENTDYFDALGG